MPNCKLCGQAEHKITDGVLDHCRACRQPVYAGTTYWVHRRVYGYADHFYCEDCITWTRFAYESVLRRAESLYKRILR